MGKCCRISAEEMRKKKFVLLRLSLPFPVYASCGATAVVAPDCHTAPLYYSPPPVAPITTSVFSFLRRRPIERLADIKARTNSQAATSATPASEIHISTSETVTLLLQGNAAVKQAMVQRTGRKATMVEINHCEPPCTSELVIAVWTSLGFMVILLLNSPPATRRRGL